LKIPGRGWRLALRIVVAPRERQPGSVSGAQRAVVSQWPWPLVLLVCAVLMIRTFQELRKLIRDSTTHNICKFCASRSRFADCKNRSEGREHNEILDQLQAMPA